MTKIVLIKGNMKKYINVAENSTILEIAKREDIDLEGSCEGSVACSTCHILVLDSWYKKLKKPAKEEIELLEIMPNYKKNSRLGCQIKVTKDLDGLEISLATDL